MRRSNGIKIAKKKSVLLHGSLYSDGVKFGLPVGLYGARGES